MALLPQVQANRLAPQPHLELARECLLLQAPLRSVSRSTLLQELLLLAIPQQEFPLPRQSLPVPQLTR